MEQILQVTDNMPLAINLLAHLVDYEGLSNVLTRWETDKTLLLSEGHDRRTNLDASIAISLSSSRITPGAKDLLSLLSILPDGLSDNELFQTNLPIPDIRSCTAVLLATSLAYKDDQKRLRSLVPIREHIQRISPPSQFILHPIRKHFNSLLQLFKDYHGAQQGGLVKQIILNLGNIQEVLRKGLYPSHPDLVDSIHCIIYLNSFYRLTGRSNSILMDHIPSIFPQPCDHELEATFITEALISSANHPIATPEQMIAEAIIHFQHFNDPSLEGKSVQLFFCAACLWNCNGNSEILYDSGVLHFP
jgi:hypothetical protein